MDDDEDVNNVVFNDRYLLRRLRRVGLLCGWLIIYINVFRIPSRILRLLLNRAASMRCFSRYPILQSLCASSGCCISGFQKSCQLVASVQPGCCGKAARFLMSCLAGTGRFRLIIILTLWPTLLNSDYSPICISKSVPGSGATSISFLNLERLESGVCKLLAGDSHCFWFFSALLVQLQYDGFHTSNPSCFDGSCWRSPRLWLLRLWSLLLCLSRYLLNGACQSWAALWLLYLIFFYGNS